MDKAINKTEKRQVLYKSKPIDIKSWYRMLYFVFIPIKKFQGSESQIY